MGKLEISAEQVAAGQDAAVEDNRHEHTAHGVPQKSLCPSAPWNQEGGVVFGVTGGTAKAPRVMFLKQMLAPSPALEAKLGGVAPEEVFRVAAPCAGSGCKHHNAATQGCGLATNIVQQVDQVYDEWATCGIRPDCVWWKQEGVKACVRCPQIATRNKMASDSVRSASTPGTATA